MRIALCMPVGPAGIRGETAQLLCSLVASANVQVLAIASGHLVRARNAAWQAAVADNVDRVIWLDADVWTSLAAFEAFVSRGENLFDDDQMVAWVGAVCMRRGPEKLVNFCYSDGNIRLGLGLALWHVPRMKRALALVGDLPFRWIEPLGEDYRACDDVHAAGYRVTIDAMCPTMHDDVGVWPGEMNPGEMAKLKSEMLDSISGDNATLSMMSRAI